MNLWGHRFSKNANQKLQGFLPYQTNKDCSQKNCLHSPENHQKKCYDPCLYGRAEIFVIFGLHFGRNDDFINSFSNELTFSNNRLFLIIGKSFVFFSTRICYKSWSISQLKELYTVKLLHIKIYLKYPPYSFIWPYLLV